MKHAISRLTHSCPPEFLEAIGDVTVSYASLQWTLDILICSLLTGLDSDKRGAVTANLTFSQLVTLLDALYVHHEPKQIPYSSVAEIIQRLRDVAQARNRLNHSMIMHSRESLKLISFTKNKKGRGLKAVESTLTIDEIVSLTKNIQEVGGALIELNQAIEGVAL